MLIEIFKGTSLFSRLRVDYNNAVVDIEAQPNRDIRSIPVIHK